MEVFTFAIFLTDNCQKGEKLFYCLSLIVPVQRNKRLSSSQREKNLSQRGIIHMFIATTKGNLIWRIQPILPQQRDGEGSLCGEYSPYGYCHNIMMVRDRYVESIVQGWTCGEYIVVNICGEYSPYGNVTIQGWRGMDMWRILSILLLSQYRDGEGWRGMDPMCI